MPKNYFYLAVGILCVLFAVTHTLNGITTSLPALDNCMTDNNAKVVFTYVWHIIGIENLVFGIALLIMSFQKDLLKVKFAAWVIIALLAMRWLVIAIITLKNNGYDVIQILPDTVAIFVVIVLIIVGTRTKAIIEIK